MRVRNPRSIPGSTSSSAKKADHVLDLDQDWLGKDPRPGRSVSEDAVDLGGVGKQPLHLRVDRTNARDRKLGQSPS